MPLSRVAIVTPAITRTATIGKPTSSFFFIFLTPFEWFFDSILNWFNPRVFVRGTVEEVAVSLFSGSEFTNFEIQL